MRRIHRPAPALILSLLAFILPGGAPAHAATAAHVWSRRFGGTAADAGRSVAVDASGNVFLLATFEGTADFGGGAITSLGLRDGYVGKYSAQGAFLWGVRFGGTGDEVASGIAVDGSGNVIVTGSFTGTANFGGSNLTSAGAADIYIAEYSAAGQHQWSRRVGSTTADQGYSVAADAAGNVYATGYFSGTVNFGGPNVSSNSGSTDIYLVRYTPLGAHEWTQRFGTNLGDQGQGVAVDAAGNVYLTGFFQGTVGFGGGNLTSAGSPDIFLAKFDSGSVHQWSKRFGNTSTDMGNAIAADPAGNVTITGFYNQSVDFGGGTLASNGSYEVFLARFDALGQHQWSKSFGSAYIDQGYGVAADADGNVAFTGYLENAVDFGGGAVADGPGPDAFLARFAPDGGHLWSRAIVGASSGVAVACAPSGNVCVVGAFGGTVDFGGADLTASSFDAYLATYAADAAEPAIAGIVDIGNDQGRAVRITIRRSGRDQPGTYAPIVRYEAYRRNDAPPAGARTAAGAAPATGPVSRRLDLGWTEVGFVHAHGTPFYSLDVPTVGDSTIASGPYFSTFFVRAATDDVYEFFDAAADSGYSLDNLAPGIPAGFAYAGGTLSWSPSTARDFDFFTVYGANSDAFATATVVGYSVAPALDVTAAGYAYYFVTATDFAGNEGGPARTLGPSGVAGPPRAYVLSLSNFPNPFNPSTTVSYTVPARGNVTIAVYDLRGGRVATLADHEAREAGAYRLQWDGRDDAGRAVTAGTYLARIEHDGGVRTRKLMLMK